MYFDSILINLIYLSILLLLPTIQEYVENFISIETMKQKMRSTLLISGVLQFQAAKSRVSHATHNWFEPCSTIHHVSREMHICYETVSLPGLNVIRVPDSNKDLRLVDLVSRARSSSGIVNTLYSREGERTTIGRPPLSAHQTLLLRFPLFFFSVFLMVYPS